MSDGSVIINVLADDKEAQNLLKSLQGIEKQTQNINAKLGNSPDPFKNQTEGAGNLTKAILGSKGVVFALDMIKSSVGGAVSRFDTMNRFPRMMEKLGFSTEQSQRSVKKLASGIEGLPTRLDEVVATTQGLTTITGDLNMATDLTLALNNAFLSSGASAEDASRGLTQFQQMLATGKVDMQSWKTLNETMNLGLKKTAESFGYVGDSAVQDFYGALSSGDITFRDFSKRLIELDKEVGGFAETAQEGSRGIATSWQNVKTAVVNGLTGIITTIDETANATANGGIVEGLDLVKAGVKTAFGAINEAVRFTSPLIGLFVEGIKLLISAINVLKPVLIGLGAGFIALKVIGSTTLIIKTLGDAFLTLQIKTLLASEAIMGFIASIGPVGWAIAGVVAIGTTLVAVLSRMSEKQKQVIEDTNAYAQATEQLVNSVSEGQEVFEANLKHVDVTAQSMEKLSGKLLDLSENQNRSAGQTKELKEGIADLNKYLGEEVYFYDEKTKGIKGNTEALGLYLEQAKGQEEINVIKEEEIRLEQEQQALQQQKTENLAQLQKAEAEFAEANIFNRGKIGESIDQLKEKETLRVEAEQINTKSIESLEERKKVVYEQTAQAQEKLGSAIQNRIIKMQDLDKEEQQLVENMKSRYKTIEEATTDVFDKINTKSSISRKEMMKNLEHNINAVRDWGDNLNKLAERKLNQEFIEKLRAMGPAGAGEVAELTKMSDKELAEFNKLFDKAGKTAPNALASSLNVSKSQIPDSIRNLVTDTGATLTDALNATDWSKYSSEITDGLAQGVTTSQNKPESAIKKMALSMEQGFTGELGIRSPSRVFMGYGRDIVSGTVNGVNSSQGSLKTAMSGLVRITNVSNQMKSAGRNAGSGFVSGLSSVTSRIMGTARNIASSVTSTIKRALKIKSPSRVTMELGLDTGAGFEGGLDEKIKDIKAKSKKLAESAIPKVDKRSLFETGKDIANMNQVNNNQETTNTTNVFNFDKIIWQGKEDIRKTMEEIGWVTEQDKWRLEPS